MFSALRRVTPQLVRSSIAAPTRFVHSPSNNVTPEVSSDQDLKDRLERVEAQLGSIQTIMQQQHKVTKDYSIASAVWATVGLAMTGFALGNLMDIKENTKASKNSLEDIQKNTERKP